MPDITMCNGELENEESCPMRVDCYRFTATPSTYQSYMAAPFNQDTKKCDFYWAKNNLTDVAEKETLPAR
jgi:hypothetical protein